MNNKAPLAIAFYKLHLVYKDDKDLTVDHIPPTKLKDFFDKLNEKGIFWYGEEGDSIDQGFWTDLSQIRYFQIIGIKGEAHEGPGQDPGDQVETGTATIEPIPSSEKN